MSSKILFTIAAGHGGLHPTTKEYVTAGKRSPKLNGEALIYEGVNNRINVAHIIEGMNNAGLDCIDIVNSWQDVPLNERVRRINELARDRKVLHIDIHSDANGNGREWDSASGIGTYIYTKASQSSIMAGELFRDELKHVFNGIAKDRGLRKRNFYMLRETNCPSVLLELGFHTNLEEAKRMLTDDWRQRVVRSVVESCKKYQEYAR